MKTSFQLEWTDYLAAQRLHWQPTGEARIWSWIIASLLLIYVGVRVNLALNGRGGFAGYFILTICLIVGFLGWIFLVILPTSSWKIFQRTQELNGSQTVEITSDGLGQTNVTGQRQWPWSYFDKWKENDRLFLLYTTPLSYIILPKRAFSESIGLSDIRNHLTAQPRPQTVWPIIQRVIFGFITVVIVELIFWPVLSAR